ncbi:DUF4348 domain-containing protein [Pseudofulvibacter geojedonensis]|uniref:DUF4348 domain-containing protein n=1 Tax=Pseudofulvibacter geojedonensis TaxID=1123758 RepID=UPI00367324C1
MKIENIPVVELHFTSGYKYYDHKFTIIKGEELIYEYLKVNNIKQANNYTDLTFDTISSKYKLRGGAFEKIFKSLKTLELNNYKEGMRGLDGYEVGVSIKDVNGEFHKLNSWSPGRMDDSLVYKILDPFFKEIYTIVTEEDTSDKIENIQGNFSYGINYRKLSSNRFHITPFCVTVPNRNEVKYLKEYLEEKTRKDTILFRFGCMASSKELSYFSKLNERKNIFYYGAYNPNKQVEERYRNFKWFKTKDELLLSFKYPDTLDNDFKSFLKVFSKDSIFQISRVSFPMKTKVLSSNLDEEVEEIITKDSYPIQEFLIDQIRTNQEYDNYSQEIKVEKDNATIFCQGIDNGILVEFEFKKIEGKWYLVTWSDLST